MIVDQSAVWKSVADSVWGNVDHCVAGSNGFYDMFERSAPAQGQKHKVSKNLNIAKHWQGLGVTTGPDSKRAGDALMYPSI
jgi:hypothetical protein